MITGDLKTYNFCINQKSNNILLMLCEKVSNMKDSIFIQYHNPVIALNYMFPGELKLIYQDSSYVSSNTRYAQIMIVKDLAFVNSSNFDGDKDKYIIEEINNALLMTEEGALFTQSYEIIDEKFL